MSLDLRTGAVHTLGMEYDTRLRQLRFQPHPSPTWVDAAYAIAGVIAALIFLAVTQ